MKLTTLHAFYVEQLKDLYSAEHQVLRALPKMVRLAGSAPLRHALNDQLHQSQVHIDRLDKMFVRLGAGPKGAACHAMDGLIAEGKDLEADDAQPTVMDAAQIVAAQRMGHYLMAGYGCVRTLATRLGQSNAAALLQEILEDVRAADRRLSELAEAAAPVPVPAVGATK